MVYTTESCVYTCTDHRLSFDSVKPDEKHVNKSIKTLYVSLTNGPTQAQIVYSGLGRSGVPPYGMDVSNWLQRGLRGKDGDFAGLVSHLADIATTNIGQLWRDPHEFCVVGLTPDTIEVRRVAKSRGHPAFKVSPARNVINQLFVFGSGAKDIDADRLSNILESSAEQGDDQVFKEMNYANIIASESNTTISPACLTTALRRSDDPVKSCVFHNWPDNEQTPVIPQLERGMDVTQLKEQFISMRNAGIPKPSKLEQMRIAANVDNTPIEALFEKPTQIP